MYNDELMHYRTKGSKNGYSKDPNYIPIGERAKGVLTKFQNGAKSLAYQRRMAAQGPQMSIGDLRKQETEQTPERNMYDVAAGKIKNAYIHAASRARLAARKTARNFSGVVNTAKQNAQTLGDAAKKNKFVRDTGEILERAGSKISSASGNAAANLKKRGTELLKSVRNNTVGRYKAAKLAAGTSPNPYSNEWNRQNTQANAAKLQSVRRENAERIKEEERKAKNRELYDRLQGAATRGVNEASNAAKNLGRYGSKVAEDFKEVQEAMKSGNTAQYFDQKRKEAEERRKRNARTAHNWINRNDPYRNG